MRIPAMLLLPGLLLLAGCLTVESKEYHIRLTGHQSGEATMIFHNLQSESDDTTDVSGEDFDHLIASYVQGTEFEKENPGFKNVRKRVYERDGKLEAELSFQFDSLAALRIFQFDEDSPFMYFVGSPMSSEVLSETNGTFGSTWMPVVFWPKETKEIYIRTRVVSQASYHHSLVERWKEWQQKSKN